MVNGVLVLVLSVSDISQIHLSGETRGGNIQRNGGHGSATGVFGWNGNMDNDSLVSHWGAE